MQANITELLQILQLLVIVFGGGFSIFKMGKALQKFESLGESHNEKITKMQQSIEKMENVITQMAVEKVRLDNQGIRLTQLEKLVEDLRRGEGMVLPLNLAAVRRLSGGNDDNG